MKKILFIAASLILTAAVALAVGDSNIKVGDGTYEVKTPKGSVAIVAFSGDVFRVTVFPPGMPAQFPESKIAKARPSKVGVCTNMTG